VIEYISGKLVAKHPTHVVVDVSGMGYWVHIPVSSFPHLGEPGTQVKLFTHHHIREDAEELYGFATSEERQIFRYLIDVSGIGPRLAQNILSGLPAAPLREALLNGDLATLTRIPGVGKKTAERMIVELKDKMAKLLPAGAGAGTPVAAASADDEAVLALVSLGYTRYDAQQAVTAVRRKGGTELPLPEVIRAAIQAAR
jgi:Holliday junction DNA helicase RuvA